MVSRKELEDYILSFHGTRLDYPFGEDAAVYKVKDKIFAIVREKSDPIQLSLKCDPNLSVVLRERYESVQPGYHLNKKHWNTIVLTGQVSWTEIQDLIGHSYQLVDGAS